MALGTPNPGAGGESVSAPGGPTDGPPTPGGASSSTEEDWRLDVEIDHSGERHETLERLLSTVRGAPGEAVDDVRAAAGDDVSITHDGQVLFAYAATKPEIESARRAIDAALHRDGLTATIQASHWDRQIDAWRPIDGSATSAAEAVDGMTDAQARKVETQTIVCSAGRLVRGSVEQAMQRWSEEVGIECRIVEHPHLLTTQIAFTVTGPRHKLDEFRQGLKAEARATFRADGFGTGIR